MYIQRESSCDINLLQEAEVSQLTKPTYLQTKISSKSLVGFKIGPKLAFASFP